MKKQILLTFLLAISAAVFAQVEPEPAGTIRLGGHLTPEFYTTSVLVGPSSNGYYFTSPTVFNLSGGLQAEIILKGRLEAGFGLQYGTKNFRMESYCLNCVSIPADGFDHYILRRAYLEMPVWLQWHLMDARVKFYVQAGVLPGLLVRKENPELLPIREDKWSLSAMGAWGMKYRITDDWNLFTNLRYQHTLTNRKKTAAMNIQGFGISFGLEYKL